ncbi:hypothetical protein [Catenuloplanes japonicus]|uniref:hypothetical protein n=1 Tax=Catenuloplanes japonicus TaxID=33876 RepID=UPI00068F6213|nr:hypothetical protein [Catenuloplanes japonicus]
MGIPDEDLGPSWLHDYGRIEADIEAMSQFAHHLIDEIQHNYTPHATRVIADMESDHPPTAAEFEEHARFLGAHETAMRASTDNVYWYIEGGTRLSNAAAEVSSRYADADAFSLAQTKDVLEALNTSGAGVVL